MPDQTACRGYAPYRSSVQFADHTLCSYRVISNGALMQCPGRESLPVPSQNGRVTAGRPMWRYLPRYRHIGAATWETAIWETATWETAT